MFDFSSYAFGVALRAFIVVIGFGLFFAGSSFKKKKASKNIERFAQYKEIDENEVLKRIRNEDAYSEAFKKNGLRFVKNNAKLTANMITSLKIDLKQLDLIIARADETEITAEELAVKKIFGMFGALGLLILGIFINYLFFILAAVFYLYFAVNPISKLNEKHKKKAADFKEKMPSYLRLVANATAVGNSIEEALKKVGEKYPCVITDEIKKAEAEASYSTDWLQALLNTSYRADIPEYEQLVSEVRIAKEKGTSITDILNKLAEKIEKENAYDAEAEARKKASTIIFPVFMLLFAPMLLGILLPVGTTVMSML